MKKFEIPILCYPGHIFVTSKISSTARIVLDALFAIADNYNSICLDEDTIKTLLEILEKCEKNFTEQTLRNSVSELYQNELLLRLKNNYYYLNPTYFVKHTFEEHRKELFDTLWKKGLFDKIVDKRAFENEIKNPTNPPEVHA